MGAKMLMTDAVNGIVSLESRALRVRLGWSPRPRSCQVLRTEWVQRKLNGPVILGPVHTTTEFNYIVQVQRVWSFEHLCLPYVSLLLLC